MTIDARMPEIVNECGIVAALLWERIVLIQRSGFYLLQSAGIRQGSLHTHAHGEGHHVLPEGGI